jgi:diketogulonate reductase-like aldo/keto reductase
MRKIPRSGEMLPAIGLGTYLTFDLIPGSPRNNIREVIKRFWDGGGRVFDTSPLYGSGEISVGDFATCMGINEQMFITNKIWSTGEYLADDSHARKSFEQSQQRLWREKIDLMQVHYSIQMRLAEERILPAAMDKGTAVLVNMPFEKARLFKLVEGRPLPDFAKEFDCRNWAEFFLKWVISHPAITCAIPATSNPAHQSENIRAMRGKLPDQEMRTRMVKFMETIPGFDSLQQTPAYPGKAYNGYIRRAMNARAAAAK